MLGWVSLTGLAWMGELWARRLFPEQAHPIPWVGIFLVGEWHLAWASGSGMETILFALVILLLFWWISRFPRFPFWAGLICGLCVWIRPDGLTLAGPVGFMVVLSARDGASRVRGLLLAASGILAGVAPYFLFNLALGGSGWPNTLYAKQAEYAIRQQTPYLHALWPADQLTPGWGGHRTIAGIFGECLDGLGSETMGDPGGSPVVDRLQRHLRGGPAGRLPAWTLLDAGDGGLFRAGNGRYPGIDPADEYSRVAAAPAAGLGLNFGHQLGFILRAGRRRVRAGCGDY